MACYHPISAWRYPVPDAQVQFRPQPPPYEYLRLPCGKCMGCRADQSLMWSIRAYHESSLHEKNSFLTLTYSDENLPLDGLINKKHLQLFVKRLRKHFPPKSIRYIACGEYGDATRRPHYHAILFGADFLHDKIELNTELYTSPTLEKLWGLGQVSLAPISMASICYVCGYVTKKIHDTDTFSLMSRRPGIGHRWLDQFKDDLRRTNTVTIEGKEYAVPPRYITWEKDFLSSVVEHRQEYAKLNSQKATDKSLDNREKNHLSKHSQKKETL